MYPSSSQPLLRASRPLFQAQGSVTDWPKAHGGTQRRLGFSANSAGLKPPSCFPWAPHTGRGEAPLLLFFCWEH